MSKESHIEGEWSDFIAGLDRETAHECLKLLEYLQGDPDKLSNLQSVRTHLRNAMNAPSDEERTRLIGEMLGEQRGRTTTEETMTIFFDDDSDDRLPTN